jgi:putative transposase
MSYKEIFAFTVFERAFKHFGLPLAIRTDNGPSLREQHCLLRFEQAIERIKPGKPQQNGRHERMHLTLKKEATRPPAKNLQVRRWTSRKSRRRSGW